jgi:hypothetical protein
MHRFGPYENGSLKAKDNILRVVHCHYYQTTDIVFNNNFSHFAITLDPSLFTHRMFSLSLGLRALTCQAGMMTISYLHWPLQLVFVGTKMLLLLSENTSRHLVVATILLISVWLRHCTKKKTRIIV